MRPAEDFARSRKAARGWVLFGVRVHRGPSPGERTREGIGARIPPRKPKPLNPPPGKGGVQNAVKIGLAGLVLLAVAAGLAVYGMGTGDDRALRKPSGRVMDAEAVARNRQMAIDMFYHSYDNYMRHAFPRDELAPMSCKGHDTQNCHGCMLTFYDALDTLAVLGNKTEYQRVVSWLAEHGAATFDRDVSVSVFETNIRVLGSLISNHLLASDEKRGLVPGYDGVLLKLAIDVGLRLLQAYDTPTGLPYGSVNFKSGVRPGETPVSATATGGTCLLEFHLLSKLSGIKAFRKAAEKATKALWSRRSKLGLLGSHINVQDGNWVYFDSGIGGGIDSFFEYLMKAHLLTGKQEYLAMFEEGYRSINEHTRLEGWHIDVEMNSGKIMFPFYRSLQSFWPGLQVLYGDLEPARALFAKFMSVWRKYGFVPEAFNVQTGEPQDGLKQYPLRPEMAESAFYLHRATGDDEYRYAGQEILESLHKHAKVDCGYTAIEDVVTKKQRDHMDSYFIAETVKYLYLLFDEGETSADFRDPSKFIFNTEAHLLPLPSPPDPEFLLSPGVAPNNQAKRQRQREGYKVKGTAGAGAGKKGSGKKKGKGKKQAGGEL